MLLLKRILSNVIDFILYSIIFIVYVLSTSGFQFEKDHLDIFYFVAFVSTFLFPILLIKNTLGKEILGLKWQDQTYLRLKISLKYLSYFILVTPTFSVFSAITSFPYLNTELFNLDLVLSFSIILAFFITDLITLIVSLGKFHFLDYVLNLKLQNHPFVKNQFKLLGFIFLFFALILLSSIIQYQKQISFSKLSKDLTSQISKEPYPRDIVHGGYALVFKDKSSEVKIPSKPLSFIYNLEYNRKTIFIYLPYQIYKSEEYRKEIAYEVIFKSLENDIYFNYSPAQTRIVMKSNEEGYFLDFKSYTYYYYFDNNFPEWGVYGGIKADSTLTRKYVDFVNNVKLGKIKKLEKVFNLTIDEINRKLQKDSILQRRTQEILSNSKFDVQFTYSDLTIEVDTSKLNLKRIPFENSKLTGYHSLNFPYRDLNYTFFKTNLLSEETFLGDENISTLIYIIEEYAEGNL